MSLIICFLTMKLIISIAILFTITTVVSGNKYDKLVEEVLEKLKANKTAFDDFHLFHGIDIRRGDNKFEWLSIYNTTIVGLSQAKNIPGALGRDEPGGNIYVSRATVSIPSVYIKGLVAFEDKNGKFILPFLAKQFSEDQRTIGAGGKIKISLMFEKAKKTVKVYNIEYSLDNPIFEVDPDCKVVDKQPSAISCEDAGIFARILGLRNVGNTLSMRLISAIQSMEFDF